MMAVGQCAYCHVAIVFKIYLKINFVTQEVQRIFFYFLVLNSVA